MTDEEETVSETSDISDVSTISAVSAAQSEKQPAIEPEGMIVMDGEEENGEEEEEQEEELSRSPLELMTDQELIAFVNELETSIRHMQLENQIFMDFLQHNNPSALEGLEQTINFAIAIALKRTPIITEEPIREPSSHSKGSSIASLAISRKSSRQTDSLPSIANLLDGRGPRINIAAKTEMIMKTMEELQAAHEAFVKKSLRTKTNLKSELEEFAIRENDITFARNQFEYNVVVNGVDMLTGRVSAEKWIRYMDDWLKTAGLAMEKLRLRTASLKQQYRKLSLTFMQRKELGANVHAVDFDQLEIANKHLILKIDQKQVHLIELKKMNGGANLVLSRHKKFLLQQQLDYNKLKQEIDAKEQQIKDLEEEFVKVEEEKDLAREKFEYFKNFKNTYRVPDVMEYVMLKKELDEIKKNIKIWQRRKNIQDISLNASIRELKHLTGSTTLDPSWIQDPVAEDGNGDFELIIVECWDDVISIISNIVSIKQMSTGPSLVPCVTSVTHVSI